MKVPGGTGGKAGSGTGPGSGRAGSSGISADCADGPVVGGGVKATAIIVAMARIAVFPLIGDWEGADFTTALCYVLLALAMRANQFQ